MNWKRIGRAALCLLVVCCLILNMSPIKAEALALEITLGTIVGVGGILAIGAIMIGLGVSIGVNNTDFWDLAEDIYDSLPDKLKMTHAIAGFGVQQLINAWLYGDTYHFHEDVVRAVNDYLTDATSVTYDEATSTVVSDAPVRTEYSFQGSSNSSSSSSSSGSYGGSTDVSGVNVTACVNDAFIYGLSNHATQFNYCAMHADYCYYIEQIDGNTLIAWSEKPASVVEYDSTYDITIHTPCWYVKVSANGNEEVLQSDSRTVGAIYYERAKYSASTDLDLSLSNVSKDISASGGSSVSVDDGSSDDGSDPVYYFPTSLLPTKEEVESLTQDSAQSGSVAEPDFVVDAETGTLLDSNVDNSWLLEGVEVGVDAQTAVASILIALGISPGTANTDFRALVDNVIAELPDSYFYAYDSSTYGSWNLLRCWLCDDKYYVTKDVLEYINDLLYNGSDSMEPIFSVDGFHVDASKYPDYNLFVSRIDSLRNSSSSSNDELVSYFDNGRYLLCFHTTATNVNTYAVSNLPFYIHGSYVFEATGNFVRSLYDSSGYMQVASYEYPDSYFTLGNCFHMPPSYVVTYDVYESGISLVGDLYLFESSSDLSELQYGAFVVSDDGKDVVYYPIKLFETLEDAESATQTEVQAGLNSSTAITVDVTTGEIVDVLPGIGEGEGTEETIPVVVPPPGGDVGSDTGSDTGTGTGSGTGSDTGTDTGTDSATLEGLLQGHRTNLLDGLRDFFEWLGDLINNAIEWLADTLVSGYRRVAEWLSGTLLAGIRSIIEWLADAILGGIRDIFVPSEDFLTAKVEALRARFSFADSIIATVAAMGSALYDFETSPPIIYMYLGEAESKYDWGDEAIALDLRWYERYKPAVDALLSALLWIFFAWRVFRKLPGIISGMEGDSPFEPVSDGRFGSSSGFRRFGSGSMKRRE